MRDFLVTVRVVEEQVWKVPASNEAEARLLAEAGNPAISHLEDLSWEAEVLEIQEATT
jgi:hypothetical protein